MSTTTILIEELKSLNLFTEPMICNMINPYHYNYYYFVKLFFSGKQYTYDLQTFIRLVKRAPSCLNKYDGYPSIKIEIYTQTNNNQELILQFNHLSLLSSVIQTLEYYDKRN